MNTNDRIKILAKRYKVLWSDELAQAHERGLHHVINLFDVAAKTDTSGGFQKAPMGRVGMVGINPVGLRLTLHEKLTP